MRPKGVGSGRSKKDLLFSGKVVISILLLFLIAKSLNIGLITSTIVQSDRMHLAFAFLLMTCHLLVGFFRWGLLIRKYSPLLPAEIVQFSSIGYFYNLFVPGGFAGDVVKGIKTKDAGPRYSAAAVILDRYFGMLSFVFLLLPSLLLFRRLFVNDSVRFCLLILCLLTVASFVLFLKSRWFNQLVKALQRLAMPKINGLFSALSDYAADGSRIRNTLAISLISTTLLILVFEFLAKSLHQNIPVLYHFIFIPAIIIISAVPISFRGTGVRELSFILFYGQIGIGREMSVAISILYLFVMMILSIFLYALVFFTSGSFFKKSGSLVVDPIKESDPKTPNS
jgi:uncharacterized protein (TIRG00374 family)